MGLSDIFKPAYRSSNPEKRLQAVGKLEDQEILAQLAMSDPSPRVRKAAAEKVENQDLLIKIALDGNELDARIAAVERIDSQEKLAEIIKLRKNYELMGACFARITDNKILERIAHDTGYNRTARRIAIENYADESLLSEMEQRQVDRAEPKSEEKIRAYAAKYGGVRLARALGKFRGSRNALIALGDIMRMGGEPASIAVEYLTQALRHSNPVISSTAREQLVSIREADLIARMVSMIDDSALRDKILEVLREIDHPEAREILKKHKST
jgi:hypothetical protein